MMIRKSQDGWMGKEAEWWQSHRRGFTQKSLNSASAHVTHRKFHHVALGAMDFRAMARCLNKRFIIFFLPQNQVIALRQ